MTDKILKGTTSGDFPVKQPANLELGINQATAQALGLMVLQSLLFMADRVID